MASLVCQGSACLLKNPSFVLSAYHTLHSEYNLGAVCLHGLQMDQVLRVVAVDSGSLVKALAVLRTATYRLQRNTGHMLVVQPTLIGSKAADGEDMPAGSTVFYTQAIRAGEWCQPHAKQHRGSGRQWVPGTAT
jgi:hypothetical protein